MNWKIIPYESVGPIRFGMSPDEVEQILGKAEDVQGNPISGKASEKLQNKYSGYVTEFRIGDGPETIKPTVQYNNSRLVSVEIYDNIKNVGIDDYIIFAHSKIQCLDYFREISKYYAVTLDSLIFLDFGISMSLDEEWEYSPSINIFAKGEFDEIIFNGIKLGEIEVFSK